LDKGLDCIYEQDKRRGPKPGYIEEIYRRIDALEQMVVGQSLLFKSNFSLESNDQRLLSFRGAVENARQMLQKEAQSHIVTLNESASSGDGDLSSGTQTQRFLFLNLTERTLSIPTASKR
jgi:hypothetical protein